MPTGSGECANDRQSWPEQFCDIEVDHAGSIAPKKEEGRARNRDPLGNRVALEKRNEDYKFIIIEPDE